MENDARNMKSHRVRGRLVRAALTISVAASMLSVGLAFVATGQAGASTPLAFSGAPANGPFYTAPDVVLNTPYSYLGVQATGGSGGYTYSYTYPFYNTLPSGLTLNADGSITGTDTTDPSGTTVTAVISATDSANDSVLGYFTFTVDNAMSAMSTTAPPAIDPGQTLYSWNGDAVTGGTSPITYSYTGTLPDGLTLDPSSGTVSGTPAADVAAASVVITATDALANTESQAYDFTVAAPLSFVSTTNPPTIYPNETGFSWDGDAATGGTTPYTYNDGDTTPDGLAFNTSTGEFSGTVASNAADTQVDVFVTDANGVIIENTYTFIVGSDLAFVSTANPPTIDPGQASYTWDGDTATGGSPYATFPYYTYSAQPSTFDGLTFNPSTGEFSGSPSMNAVDTQVDVFASDSAGNVIENTYDFIVGAPLAFQSTANPPTIYPNETGFSWNGDAATGGVTPYTYSDGGATPDGLAFNTSTGEFSGTVASNATDMQVDVFVTDADGAIIENTYAFIVGSSLAIGTGTPPTLNDGAGSYSFSGAEASGGSGTYAYSLTAGSLPAGLSLDTTSGLISQLGAANTTATATTQTFTVTVIDSASNTSSGQFTITAVPETVVSPGGGGGGGGGGASSASSTLAPQLALSLTSTGGVLGTPLDLTSSGGSGTGAVTYAVTTAGTAGCAVTGATLSATAAGTCTVTVSKASDGTYAAASSAPTTVTITVAAPSAVLAVDPHAFKVVGKIAVARSTTVKILGSGFYGQPTIKSNAAGIKAVVSHDTGTNLTVKVALSALQRTGVHTFTIVLANGKSCKVNYVVVS